MNVELCEWLIEGLSEKELGEKLLDLKAMGEREERLLFRLIRETGYYTEKEVDELMLDFRRLNGLSEADRKERMGDSFFSLGKYGKALDAYQDALHFEENGRRIRKAIFIQENFKERRRAIRSSMRRTMIKWRQESCIFFPKCASRGISSRRFLRTWTRK